MIRALLTAFALAAPVLGRDVFTAKESMGCYGDKSSSPEDAEILVKAVKGLLLDKDPDVIEKYFAEDFIQHNPGFPSGRDALFDFVELPFEYEIGQVAVSADMLWMHSRIFGVGEKPIVALDIYRVEDGLIAEHWDVAQDEVPANETVSGNSMVTFVPDALMNALHDY